MTEPLLSAQTFLSDLPEEIPLYSLSGALLLPQARLPLTISEPADRAMVEDALGNGRLIGVIQPCSDDEEEKPPLYSVGCVGRITSFNELDEGKLLIVLTGVCRFRMLVEIRGSHIYRKAKPDWTPYLSDLGESDTATIDRERLVELMRIYFKNNAISVDWSVVRSAPEGVLLPTIIMICPFTAAEKQALLEAENFDARARMLLALLEMETAHKQERDMEIRQ
ncbi:MAG: LON peptidase substrate-binding domain-containing protein [Bdellovibrionales bacterium]